MLGGTPCLLVPRPLGTKKTSPSFGRWSESTVAHEIRAEWSAEDTTQELSGQLMTLAGERALSP